MLALSAIVMRAGNGNWSRRWRCSRYTESASAASSLYTGTTTSSTGTPASRAAMAAFGRDSKRTRRPARVTLEGDIGHEFHG